MAPVPKEPEEVQLDEADVHTGYLDEEVVPKGFADERKLPQLLQQMAEARIYQYVEQTFSAIPLVQAFSRESANDREFAGINRQALAAILSAVNVQLKFKVLLGLGTAMGEGPDSAVSLAPLFSTRWRGLLVGAGPRFAMGEADLRRFALLREKVTMALDILALRRRLETLPEDLG